MTDQKTAGPDLAATIANRQAVAGTATASDLVESMRGEFGKVLPASLPIDTFLRLALTELRQTPELQRCTADSLLGALMTAARLGLEPGGPLGHFYLTPRNVYNRSLNGGSGGKEWQVVPIVGYKGLVELARKSGRVGDVSADLVREGDEFRMGYDSTRGGRFIVWDPADYLEERPVVGVLASADLTGGGRQVRYLPISKVLERKARGAAGDKGPWASDRDAMIRKTGIRALAGDLPASSELRLAVAVDEEVQRYVPGEVVDEGTGELS